MRDHNPRWTVAQARDQNAHPPCPHPHCPRPRDSATSRPCSGAAASPPGWAGCSTGSTCTSTPWWPRPSSWSCSRRASPADPLVRERSSYIQAAFLTGWALGGGLFGRVGDRLGRSRALSLTILTYALFTGLAFFATSWWQLLVFRFLAALGIGGEWAVGASLLTETWPSAWRPWIAAVLQAGVNLGILLASVTVYLMADLPPRNVFLVGVLPALLVFWIRRNVPETAEWRRAREAGASHLATPRVAVRPRAAGHHREGHPRLLARAHRLVGLHVLAPAAPPQPARACGPGPRRPRAPGEPRLLPRHRGLDRGQLLRGLRGQAPGL